ncbi:MAG: methyltransferase [Bacillota bacterium]|nr:methyltransferase [Bacillota bacterium]
MRIDEIGFGDLKLIQDENEFCYGTDAVLLARFANLPQHLNVIDLCTGNGAVAFISYNLYNPQHVVGVDVNTHEIELAKESASINGIEDKMEFISEDVLNIKKRLEFESFDAVLINPPYQENGRGICGNIDAKHAARFETTANLADFFDAAAYLLKPKGTLTMVHRPSRLVDILSLARERKLEAKRLQMVAPHPGESANIVLIQFVKGGGHELKIEPEYYVHTK